MHEAEPQSLLGWIFSALGPMYLVLLPLSAIVSFLFVLVLVYRGKGAMAAASLVLFVHMPLMIGVFAAVQGLISSLNLIAMDGSAPRASDIAAGFSVALLAPTVAMLLMAPSYLAAAIGSFARAVATTSIAGARPTRTLGKLG